MTDDGFDITRRKILGAVGTVGVASAGAGLGTTAFFNDTESFDNNVVQAGQLDLKVDWQQTYRNGSAGGPGPEYVNAFPDHDDDGIQSLPDQDDDDEPETYTDDGANIQEYLTCKTLDAVSVPEDYQSDNYPDQQSLIELDDVKPGDSGEVTFSFHLCDNPACVYFRGGNLSASENGQTEPEAEVDDSSSGDGELLDYLQVRAWYDLDCDNVYDEGESTIFAWGTLDEFIESVSGKGRQLNPLQYGITGVNPDTETTSGSVCRRLGKLEFDGDTVGDLDIKIADDSDGETITEDDENDDEAEGEDERYKLRDTENDEYVTIDITGYEVKRGGEIVNEAEENLNDDDEVVGFYFEVDGVSDAGIGICQVDVKGGGGAQGSDAATASYGFDDGCTQGIVQNEPGLRAPVNTGGQQSAVSNAVFYYCDGAEVPSQGFPCFPGEQTFCVGFEWFLPSDVGNDIQTDTASFDVGFYAEQARHNDNVGQSN